MRFRAWDVRSGCPGLLPGRCRGDGVGIAGLIKTGRAESRLEAFEETSQANHRVGVASLSDGVAANYSVSW